MSYADEFDTPTRGPDFTIKDSGERSSFASGMVRDASVGKIDYTSIFFGPMLKRWADHLTKGRKKYPDPEVGVPNWTLAGGQEELDHARQSLLRHVVAYMEGERDEDHAAAIYFNINLIEYIQAKLALEDSIVLPSSVASSSPLGEWEHDQVEGVGCKHRAYGCHCGT